jgi:hypothetical protein
MGITEMVGRRSVEAMDEMRAQIEPLTVSAYQFSVIIDKTHSKGIWSLARS